jgi:hypothetical protein
MVEANPTAAATSSTTQPASGEPERTLMICSNNFIHLNEGNIKTFYKISSCIGRGKLTFLLIDKLTYRKPIHCHSPIIMKVPVKPPSNLPFTYIDKRARTTQRELLRTTYLLACLLNHSFIQHSHSK